MAYDSKGRLILSHELSTRENLDLIAECLGDFRISTLGRDLGMLCTSPKVNKWSKIKPVNLQNNKLLADSDYKLANYGINIEGLYYNNRYDIFDAVLANQVSYNYIKPSGSLFAFRAWDFDGYNHLATQPYDVTIIQNSDVQSKSVVVALSNYADLRLSDFAPSGLPTNLSNYYLVALYRLRGGGTTPSKAYFKQDEDSSKNLTITNLDNGLSGTARFDVQQEGIYDVVVCLTSYAEGVNEDETDGYYWCLPEGKGTASYVSNYIGVYIQEIDVTPRDANGNIITNNISIVKHLECDFEFRHRDDYDYQFDYELVINYGEYDNGSLYDYSTQTEQGTIYSSGDFWTISVLLDVSSYGMDVNRLGIEASLRDISNGQQYYIDFKKKKLTRTYVSPVRIIEI